MDSLSQQKGPGASAKASGKTAEAKKTSTSLKQEKKPAKKPPPPSSVPCRYFKQGDCWYGELCRFKHAGASSSSSSSSSSASAAAAAARSASSGLFNHVSFDVFWNEMPVCRFWSRGVCKSGHECNFKHPDSVQQRTLFESRYRRINDVVDDVIRESLQRHGRSYGFGRGLGYGHCEHFNSRESHITFADDKVVLCYRDYHGLDDFNNYHGLDDFCDDDDDDDDDYYDDESSDGDYYEDRISQRMRNCGFTDDEVYELSLQGIKPWDPEAWDALDVINGYY